VCACRGGLEPQKAGRLKTAICIGQKWATLAQGWLRQPTRSPEETNKKSARESKGHPGLHATIVLHLSENRNEAELSEFCMVSS